MAGLARRGLSGAIAVLLAALTPSAGQAAWLKAETDHFIVYSDGRETELRDFATHLITFDAMLRKVYKPAETTRPTGKVEIFLVRGKDQLRRILPGAPATMRGYYSAQPSGVYAVALRARVAQMADNEVLFHEYMHRVMQETAPSAHPAWLVEAYAEYFQTARIRPDHIELGRDSPVRAETLSRQPWLPWDELLGKTPDEVDKRRQSIYYAQAWILLRYVLSDSARTQQLDAALRRIAAGEAPAPAVYKALGMDPAALTKALQAYITVKPAIRRMPNPLSTPPVVSLSKLPPSADGLLLESQRLIDGVPWNEQAAFLTMTQGQAGRFPGDRFADLTLARAEANFGDAEAAQAIVGRWLATAPDDVDILRAAAEIHLAAARRDPERRKDHLRAARPYLAKAYERAPDDFRVLYDYVFTRTVEPGFPDENDIDLLLRACRLAPSVPSIPIFAAQALIYRGRKEEARQLLLPIAHAPHGGWTSAQAKRLIDTGTASLIVPNAEGLKPAAR